MNAGSYSHTSGYLRMPIPVISPHRSPKICRHPPHRRQQLLEGLGTWHRVAQASAPDFPGGKIYENE